MPKIIVSIGSSQSPENLEAYELGKQAKKDNIRVWKCPYKDMGQEKAWFAGWYDEERKIMDEHDVLGPCRVPDEILEEWFKHYFNKGEVMARSKAKPGKVRTRAQVLRAYKYHERLLKEVHPNTPKIAEYHQRRMGELFALLNEMKGDKTKE